MTTTERTDFYDTLTAASKEHTVQLAEDDLKWLMSSERGRRVMRRILEVTGQLSSSYVDHNSHGTAYNEGRRMVGLGLLSDIRRLCPEQELAMYQEAMRQNDA